MPGPDLTIRMSRQDVGAMQRGVPYTQHDRLSKVVHDWFKAHGIPYPSKFVCIAVWFHPPASTSQYFAYGEVTVYLKPSLINEMFVVESGDIQNLAKNKRKVKSLEGLTTSERLKVLAQAADTFNLYAEARVARAITWDDVDSVEYDSGEVMNAIEISNDGITWVGVDGEYIPQPKGGSEVVFTFPASEVVVFSVMDDFRMRVNQQIMPKPTGRKLLGGDPCLVQWNWDAK